MSKRNKPYDSIYIKYDSTYTKNKNWQNLSIIL